jgi:hypothetical protein
MSQFNLLLQLPANIRTEPLKGSCAKPPIITLLLNQFIEHTNETFAASF